VQLSHSAFISTTRRAANISCINQKIEHGRHDEDVISKSRGLCTPHDSVRFTHFAVVIEMVPTDSYSHIDDALLIVDSEVLARPVLEIQVQR